MTLSKSIDDLKTSLLILLKSVGVFLTLFLVMLLVHLVIILLGLAVTQNRYSPEQFLLERLYPVFVAVILIYWTRKNKEKIYNHIKTAIKLTKKNVQTFVTYSCISLLILYTLFAGSLFFDFSVFVQYGYTDFPWQSILKQFILVGLLGNILVAVGEEIIFRGFLLNYIKEVSKSELFALLFTSLMFSFHIYPDILNNVIAFIAGIALGYAYLKFRTLYIPMGIHFAYSLFNISIASESSRGPQLPYLIKFDYPMIADGFGAWVDLFIILGVVLILVFLWIKKAPVGEETVKNTGFDLSLTSSR